MMSICPASFANIWKSVVRITTSGDDDHFRVRIDLVHFLDLFHLLLFSILSDTIAIDEGLSSSFGLADRNAPDEAGTIH